jgi:hypothetical protein
MKQVTTITLTFKLTHPFGQTSIENVRDLINKLRDYNNDHEVEVITNDDTNDCTFVKHNGKYSRQFGFNSVDAFVRKYAKFGAGELTAVLRDYGDFVECDSKTEEVEDGEQKQ